MIQEIFRLALPVMVGMISSTVLNIVDTAMVGRLGNEALGAVGLGSFFILVMILIFGSLGIGTQAITSRRLGEKRNQAFAGIIFNAMLLALLVGIATSLAGFLLSPRIFTLLSSRSEVVRIGTPYLSIRFLGLFAMIMIFTLRGFVFGLARVRIDMIVSVIINLLNIVLNWFLIFGHGFFPRLEARGAAIASVISTVVGLIIYLIFVKLRILDHLPGSGRGRLLSRQLMWQITKISTPRAVQSFSVIGFLVFLSFVGRLGVGELAISNIIFKAFNLSFMLGMAVGTASATLVGRSMGEENQHLAVRYGWHAAGLGSLMMGVIGALFMFFPREIMGLFTASRETVELGVKPFRLLGAFQLIDGVGIVLSRTLQGAGSTLFVMISEMICIWGVLIPSAWLALEILRGGLIETWSSIFLYIIFFAVLMVWKFHEGGWKKIRI
ncbi:MAG: MATE family efflux transporter [Candidatus Krumholzibacteriota bacterium]|nr:MATE family efflux transporter [Candidatus Krumholzibacteriota bacterium]